MEHYIELIRVIRFFFEITGRRIFVVVLIISSNFGIRATLLFITSEIEKNCIRIKKQNCDAVNRSDSDFESQINFCDLMRFILKYKPFVHHQFHLELLFIFIIRNEQRGGENQVFW